MKINNIYEISANKPGPTLALIAGVHGNERAGVYALEEVISSLEITRGKIFVVFANPPAIEQNVRMVNKNLNRCFLSDNNGSEPEDVRAREIMSVLDQCDASLDLHMFYDDNGLPFVICEDNAIAIAKLFDVDIISTGWSSVEPGGTDGYMYEKGKIGLCVECGPISKASEYTAFAKRTVFQFLKYYDMAGQSVSYSSKPKRFVRAQKAIFKTSDNFMLSPKLHNFQRLEKGKILARDGNKTWVAEEKQCIIFPHYKARINEEAYIIGYEASR